MLKQLAAALFNYALLTCLIHKSTWNQQKHLWITFACSALLHFQLKVAHSHYCLSSHCSFKVIIAVLWEICQVLDLVTFHVLKNCNIAKLLMQLQCYASVHSRQDLSFCRCQNSPGWGGRYGSDAFLTHKVGQGFVLFCFYLVFCLFLYFSAGLTFEMQAESL